jgi:hypothetical protein
MEARKIKMGIVMAEMGFIPQNQSVSGALHQNNRICDSSLVKELERWLEANKAHW